MFFSELGIDLWRPAAGLMIFLLAMNLIEGGVRALAGHRVKQLIAQNTRFPLRGVVAGTAATAVLQSSSLVGLLVLAFVGARIMALRQALLIIFGANLGTTATGWLVALIGFKLDLDTISLPLIATGGLLYTAFNHGRIKQIGQLGLGLGLLLLALQFMKSAVGDLESIITPEDLQSFALWEYALFGIFASAIMQSSSAVMVLTLSSINSGFIDLPAGAALMIGADLGTTSTVLLGAIGGSANKKRVALGHVLFNLVTDIIAFALLLPLVRIVSVLEDPLLSLVAFHTLFNVLGVLLWTPFVTQFARLLEQVFTRPSPGINRYLEPATAHVPESVIASLQGETGHLGERVFKQNHSLYDAAPSDAADQFTTAYKETKTLEAEILEYALDLKLLESDSAITTSIDRFLQAARSLLLSSKLCKDNLDDLRELADYQPDLSHKLMTTQRAFYDQLSVFVETPRLMDADEIASLVQLNERGHERLHDEIYLLIKNDQLPRERVSTVLNVNRALYQSNLSALTGYSLLAAESSASALAA